MKIVGYAPIIKIDALMKELKENLKENFRYETDDCGCYLIFKDDEGTTEVDLCEYLDNISSIVGFEVDDLRIIDNNDKLFALIIPKLN